MRQSGQEMGRRGRKSNSRGMKWNRRGKEEEPQGKEKEPQRKRFPYMNLAFSRSCARNAAPTSALSTSRRTVAILTLIAFAIRRWEQPEATVQTGLPTLDALRPARYRRGPGVGALRDGEGSWVMLGSPARQSRLTEKLLAQNSDFLQEKILVLFARVRSPRPMDLCAYRRFRRQQNSDSTGRAGRHARLPSVLARRPLSRSHAAITAPRSAASPKKPVASEMELAPISSVEPVRLIPM